jgi:hypothetical protein
LLAKVVVPKYDKSVVGLIVQDTPGGQEVQIEPTEKEMVKVRKIITSLFIFYN